MFNASLQPNIDSTAGQTAQDSRITSNANKQPKMSGATNATAAAVEAATADEDSADQFAPNETILQLVAQIPNHPLQKIAQKLIVDRPKNNFESHPKNSGGNNTSSSIESPIPSTTSAYRVGCTRSESNVLIKDSFHRS